MSCLVFLPLFAEHCTIKDTPASPDNRVLLVSKALCISASGFCSPVEQYWLELCSGRRGNATVHREHWHAYGPLCHLLP